MTSTSKPKTFDLIFFADLGAQPWICGKQYRKIIADILFCWNYDQEVFDIWWAPGLLSQWCEITFCTLLGVNGGHVFTANFSYSLLEHFQDFFLRSCFLSTERFDFRISVFDFRIWPLEGFKRPLHPRLVHVFAFFQLAPGQDSGAQFWLKYSRAFCQLGVFLKKRFELSLSDFQVVSFKLEWFILILSRVSAEINADQLKCFYGIFLFFYFDEEFLLDFRSNSFLKCYLSKTLVLSDTSVFWHHASF